MPLSDSKNIRTLKATTCAKASEFQLESINGNHYIYMHPDTY